LAYLAAILDLYSRRIVGWAMSPRIDTALVLAAWKMASSHRQPPPELLFHSDRGVQYASKDYRQALASAGAIASMSRKAPLGSNIPTTDHPMRMRTRLAHKHISTNNSLAAHLGGGRGSQGGAQQGTGARGEQYLDGLAQSHIIAALELFVPDYPNHSNCNEQNHLACVRFFEASPLFPLPRGEGPRVRGKEAHKLYQRPPTCLIPHSAPRLIPQIQNLSHAHEHPFTLFNTL
jgi:hypothetical protein